MHENYAVALYRFYFLENLQSRSAEHLQPLVKLIQLYTSSDLSVVAEQQGIEYALWEVIRASAILPYEATRKNKDEHLAIYSSEVALSKALLAFIGSNNAVINGDDWPKQHALWALAQYYNVYNKQFLNAYYKTTPAEQQQLDDDEITLPEQQKMEDLDNATWHALVNSFADIDSDKSKLKRLFSVPYVVSTFRGKSECKEGSLKNRCITPTIEQATPIKHICSDSLYIRTQKMTKAQLADSCQQLISQEAVFHEKLATNRQPVDNVFNDSFVLSCLKMLPNIINMVS